MGASLLASTSCSPPLHRVAAVGQRLLGTAVHRASKAIAGGNNRIFRIETADAAYALKFYRTGEAQRRNRLGAESSALRFLHAHGIASVPRVVATDTAENCGLYEWIEGDRVTAATSDDIDRQTEFLIALQRLRTAPEAMSFPEASAACFSFGNIFAQIDDRYLGLLRAAEAEPALAAFLGDFRRLADDVAARARKSLENARIPENQKIPAHIRVLSPSDFGLHNVLRRRDGSLAFVDFEYFGWDDPVKMVADILLHPGHQMPRPLKQRFFNLMERYFTRDESGFRLRLRVALPLFALVWCLIMLGDFHPDRKSLANDQDAADARARSLDKAYRLAAEIRKTRATDDLSSALGVEI